MLFIIDTEIYVRFPKPKMLTKDAESLIAAKRLCTPILRCIAHILSLMAQMT
jgi:hypothetical protein